MRLLSSRFLSRLLVLMAVAPFAQASDVGTVVPAGGQAITPSEEGRLLTLRPARRGETLPTYSLVRSGGEAVLVMTVEGHVLTPTEAWETFGGQARPAPPPVRPGGTLSIYTGKR